MALRINTNVAALNAHRNLAATDTRMSSNMEKLSSGYRINRASDDAAGLSVANRLRTTVKSLTVASRNVTEAKSLVNVAEGAANQIEGILERMKELATQSASDNSANDRDKIQAEFVALQAEITRIVEDTDYQGSTLLKGTFGNGLSSSNGFATSNGAATTDIYINGASAGTYTITDASGYISMTDGSSTQRISIDDAEATTVNFDLFGITIALNSQDSGTDLNNANIIVTAAANGGTFQVGTSNTAAADEINLQIGDLQLAALGIDASSVATQADASAALSTIDTAIDNVNEVLGDMGAAVNKMNYTYANIQVSIENFSASESVIRDVDMAAEMVSFTKNQILLQAGTAMLAQANMSSQNVLSLLG